MIYLKAFIAGAIIPAIILPIVLWVASSMGKPEITQQPFFYLIPVFWGVWNVFDLVIFRRILPIRPNIRLLAVGAVLGLIVAYLALLVFRIPAVMGITGIRYMPAIVAPIVYALVWRFLVKPINALFGLPEER